MKALSRTFTPEIFKLHMMKQANGSLGERSQRIPARMYQALRLPTLL